MLRHSRHCIASRSQLGLAAACNVQRVDELTPALVGSLGIDEHVLAASWPPYRRGVEFSGILGDDVAPSYDNPVTFHSDWWLWAGSLWRLDVKRFWDSPDNVKTEEMIAVYLCRRSIRLDRAAAAVAGFDAAAFEDARERTAITFGVHLAGAPGSPLSRCVAGRSTIGKVFGGDDDEQSWGWEYFVKCSALALRETWTGGDCLRFVVEQSVL